MTPKAKASPKFKTLRVIQADPGNMPTRRVWGKSPLDGTPLWNEIVEVLTTELAPYQIVEVDLSALTTTLKKSQRNAVISFLGRFKRKAKELKSNKIAYKSGEVIVIANREDAA